MSPSTWHYAADTEVIFLYDERAETVAKGRIVALEYGVYGEPAYRIRFQFPGSPAGTEPFEIKVEEWKILEPRL